MVHRDVRGAGTELCVWWPPFYIQNSRGEGDETDLWIHTPDQNFIGFFNAKN